MKTEHTNAFIGENSNDTSDRVKDGLAMLKQLLTDEPDSEYLTLNRETRSGIYWLLTNLNSALSFEIKR